jgi:hypothetical protein
MMMNLGLISWFTTGMALSSKVPHNLYLLLFTTSSQPEEETCGGWKKKL